jgi:chromosome segregation ATPase
MDLWSIGSKIAETARDVLTEEQADEHADEQESFVDVAQSPGVSMVEAALLDEAMRDLEQMTQLCEKQKAELASARRQEDETQLEVRAELSQVKARLRRSEADKDGAEKKFHEEVQRARAEGEAEAKRLREEVARLQQVAEAGQSARGDENNLRLQVAALTTQLTSERDDTSEERKQEVAALQEKDAEVSRARETIAALQREVAAMVEREQAAQKQLVATKEKSDLLRAHLLEREEELEQMAQTIATSKVRVLLLFSICCLFHICRKQWLSCSRSLWRRTKRVGRQQS